tara:strand:- start:10620 stop:11306 length:687 start_codon:yes stop_codon:yes gene_type:complete
MIINHVCHANDWIKAEEIKGAKTLILGSFNPYNPNNQNTEYFYGRSSNYFWKVIASLLLEHEHYFTDKLTNKLAVMQKYKFCFLDIISSIEITNPDGNDNIIRQFANDHIFTNFSDSKLFTTKHFGGNILVTRTYNQNAVDFINSQKIKKVIHTMGNTRISPNLITVPSENGLEINGFQGYINTINNLESVFNPISYSPSAYAVKRGGQTHLNHLSNWISENLGINQN